MKDPMAGIADLHSAWNLSFLASLPSDIRDRVLEGAHPIAVRRGQSLYDAYAPGRLLLIHSGRARVRSRSRDGRMATVRYAGPGQFIGLPSTVAGSQPVGAEAVNDCRLSMLNPDHFRSTAAADARLAWLVAQELARMTYESREFLGNNLFGTVEERVAQHMLELAVQTELGQIVRADQTDIADSVGSVREVVGRALRKLREGGLIERTTGGILLLDPDRLRQIADGDE